MGIFRAVQASAMPSMHSLNSHITSGFSGLPKFKQFVAARGRAPEHAILRAASVTAAFAPSRGLSQQARPLPSTVRARARLVPLTRRTAASLAPGPARVFVRTMESYCSKIQRLDAMAGHAKNFRKFSVKFVLAGENSIR